MFGVLGYVRYLRPDGLFTSAPVTRVARPITDWLYGSFAAQISGLWYDSDSRSFTVDEEDDFQAGRAAGLVQAVVMFSTVLPYMGLFLLAQAVADGGPAWATGGLVALALAAIVAMGVVEDSSNVTFEQGAV